ncbi:MAG: SMR family transporter [Pseudomonadota bacterium]
MSHWIALVLAIAGNVGANVAFKRFIQNADGTVLQAVKQPSLWIGLCLGGLLLVSYLYALRGLPLGLAYTFATSISIAGITLAGVLLYGETITLRSAVGIAVIMAGIVLLTTGQTSQT